MVKPLMEAAGIEPAQDASGRLAERLWSKVDKRGPQDCWLWRGSRGMCGKGHGQIGLGRRKRLQTHRVSWTLQHGAIPPGLLVLHHCDVPHCVNPAHLFLGTQKDNMQDAKAKGRVRSVNPSGDAHWTRKRPERLARGERHGSAKLTADQVREIRERYASGVPQKHLVNDYSVSKSQISKILLGRSWAGA
jgi:hypothetical protein